VTPADPDREHDFLVSYFPVRRGGIEVIGIGAVVNDITDRRAAERALRSQTDRYETLLLALSEVGEGMIVLEGEAIVYANQAFQTMTGYGFDELRAMNSVIELIAPEQREEARSRADLRRDRGLVDPNYQLTLRHRSGRMLDLEVAGVPLEIEGAQQLVIVVRDVTARRRAEQERERLLVAEREAHAEAQAAHRRSRFLAESSVAFEQSLDVQRTTELAAALAVHEAPANAMVVLSPPGDSARVAAVSSRDPRTESVLRSTLQRYPLQDRDQEHPVMAAMRTSRPVVLRDFDDGGLAVDAEHAAMLSRIGSRALIVVPLRARERTLGALGLGYDESLDERQVAEQLRLFEDFAARAALALDNARLYEERSHIARTLQRSLLPSELPRIPGTELAARYLAAGEGNEVGGDFYDGFTLGGNEWAMVIGDVCGKGAEAAAITALARYTARAAVLHSRRPSRVLGELNEALLRQQIDYRFCTVAFAVLQPLSTGAFAVRMAAGGHPLPLILRADGSSEYAGEPGTLLGIVDNPQLPEREFVLEPGDAMILYTDGVIEASPVDDVLGPEAFAEFVTSLAGSDASTIAGRIQDQVLEVQNGGLRDDVALLVLRVVPD
jgi:PAS domain S-box-containing protein